MIGHLILRLVIWFLLTANFGLENIIIGVCIAFLLPLNSNSPERLKDLLRALGKIIMTIPQAYIEAVDLILRPHTRGRGDHREGSVRAIARSCLPGYFSNYLYAQNDGFKIPRRGLVRSPPIATEAKVMNLNLVVIAMILALLIPLYEAWQNHDIWQKMLAFASVSTKTAVMILLVSVLRDDWMIGVVGVIILSVGNAGFMLLAHILKRMGES